MQRNVWSFVLVVVALMLASVALWAHPVSISCPIDGEYMFFERQLGYGTDAVCWYSHIHANYEYGKPATEKHEAYIPCGD